MDNEMMNNEVTAEVLTDDELLNELEDINASQEEEDDESRARVVEGVAHAGIGFAAGFAAGMVAQRAVNFKKHPEDKPKKSHWWQRVQIQSPIKFAPKETEVAESPSKDQNPPEKGEGKKAEK